MSLLARLFDFQVGAIIKSQEFDDEFNQIVNMLSGVSQNKSISIKNNDASFSVARFDQLAANHVVEFFVSGVVKSRIEQTGKFKSLVVTGTAPIDVDSTTLCPNLNADNVDGKGLFADTKEIVQALVPIYATNGNAAGSGDTDLHTRVMSANTFGNDGTKLYGVMAGTIANNANAKRLRLSVAGTTVLDTGLTAALTNISWIIEFTIIRIDSDSIKVIASFLSRSNTFEVFSNYTQIDGINFAAVLTVKAIGNGVAVNDVVQQITTFDLN